LKSDTCSSDSFALVEFQQIHEFRSQILVDSFRIASRTFPAYGRFRCRRSIKRLDGFLLNWPQAQKVAVRVASLRVKGNFIITQITNAPASRNHFHLFAGCSTICWHTWWPQNETSAYDYSDGATLCCKVDLCLKKRQWCCTL